MGKLAERYTDADRSGLYRVRDATVPRAAAIEAGALLVETRAAELAAGAWTQVAQAMVTECERACVVLVIDGGAFAAPPLADLLETIRATALARRGSGCPFFVVVVDPDARLDLPALYHEAAAQ